MKYICEIYEETSKNLNLNYYIAIFWKYLHFIYIYCAYLNPIQYGPGGQGGAGGEQKAPYQFSL